MRLTAFRLVFLTGAVLTGLLITADAQQPSILDFDLGIADRVASRMAIAARSMSRHAVPVAAMTPLERRAAVDTLWGPGLSTETKLEIFDKFWNYVDKKFAAFQGINVAWPALRDRYRPEVAAGVSRGRFAAIMNQLSLALRDGHSLALDLLVNFRSLPEPGVPLFGVGGWILDTSGACLTAQDDGSALVYDVVSPHPMGLKPGDRILGYDGRPWRELYQELIEEELPMWPLWWGSGPEGFEHTFVMSAGVNWHLFETMDVFKHVTGSVEHLPTSLMPGVVFSHFCSEQMPVAGVTKPTFSHGDFVRWGVIEGTRTGYIYVWSWKEPAPDDFAAAVHDLTQVQQVDALILDFRFNEGGVLGGPLNGLAALFDHPSTTVGMDERMRPGDHFKMKSIFPPSQFKMDFTRDGRRNKVSYDGPIAVLVGPGAISAGDFGTLWAASHPRARTFGKSTAMAVGFPTQAFLGTELNLNPGWSARIAETNTYRVGEPHSYLIHTDLVVDERVWLNPDDVAAGRDTVVQAALRWFDQLQGRLQ